MLKTTIYDRLKAPNGDDGEAKLLPRTKRYNPTQMEARTMQIMREARLTREEAVKGFNLR